MSGDVYVLVFGEPPRVAGTEPPLGEYTNDHGRAIHSNVGERVLYTRIWGGLGIKLT